MDENLIKEEMMMEHNIEITEEEVMQIIATQTATQNTNVLILIVVLGVLIYKFFKWNI